ncbi:DUF418 domain-containing protein [Cellulomonas sp. JZ18]|uniref:DUF418 domain-containing protein n=1 Tax=Cellulomonas sp. JZ18 TaxID=2654191 RepID=UPI0012D39C37|nr:DUF418 domain-containing protein [Cellulomonas sp. JZ18]QGQ19721.1 DUF418 domain-containing protein [Cellulomonas sp. JZ18]
MSTPTPPAPTPHPPAPGPSASPPAVTPVPAAERAVAPDVARGLALLGIAIANSVLHLWGVEVGVGSRPVDGSPVDRLVNGVVSLFVDRRTMPMFALLYGYGVGVVVRRRAAAWVPWPDCRRDLLRRAAWLVAFGVVHILLLFAGDILAIYGVAGLVAVAFVRAPGRRIAVVGVVALVLSGVLMGAVQALSVWAADQPDLMGQGDVMGGAEGSVLGAMLLRSWSVLIAPFGAVAALPLVLLGLWFARRGVLEQPAAHLPLLRRWVVGGLTASVLGGLPMALAVAEVWTPTAGQLFGVAALHEVSGTAGGVAFAAGVAWLVAARGTTVATLGPVGRALRAVGTRSLTCYLLQSVLFVLPLAAWAGGLGERLSSAGVVAWAVGVWLVTVAVAVALERVGRRGPAEALYRRLVYRPGALVAAR